MKPITRSQLFILLFLLVINPLNAEGKEEVEKKFKDAASQLKFIMPIDFGVTCFMHNYATKEERASYDRVMRPLMERDYATSDVIRLLRHESPQVRSLAALTLIKRCDPRMLPHIAELLTDNRYAFCIPYQETCCPFWPKDKMPPLQETTVSQIAGACLSVYLSASKGIISFPLAQPIDPKTFERYWMERKDRAFTLGWFMAHYPYSYQSIKRDMEKLPSYYREWYLIYLMQYDKTERIKIATEKEIEGWMLSLGRKSILQFLRTKAIPLDDPDCSLLSEPNISGIAELFLKNSHLVLQKEDAYFLLEEARKIPYPYMARWWYIGAAQLLPERAGAILGEILEKLKYPWYAGETAYHLFRLVESRKITYLRDWFYKSNKEARSYFIHLIKENDLPEKENLIRVLAQHDKFNTLEWYDISAMVEIVKQGGSYTIKNPKDERMRQSRLLKEYKKRLKKWAQSY